MSAPTVAEVDPCRSGVEQHHGDQRGERHEGDHEEWGEVPPVAGRLDPPRRLKHVVIESTRSNQVVVPATQRQRELVSATVGGSADPTTQPPTNGNQTPNHLPVPAPGAAEAMESQPAAGDRPASMILLYVWILLFGFVGTQLAWTLRPFFGSPKKAFELFRDIEGTFYSDILGTLGSLFG